MNAMHLPGLDAYLTSPDEPRRRYRTREEALDAMTAEIRADRERMLGLLEEKATEQDESEQLDELMRLRLLLAAPQGDAHAAGQLEIYRREFRALCNDVAKAEAALVLDGEL